MKGGKNLERVFMGQEIPLLPEEVQIFHRVDGGSLEEQWPGGTYDDMYLMPQIYQFVGKIGQVDSDRKSVV